MVRTATNKNGPQLGMTEGMNVSVKSRSPFDDNADFSAKAR